VIFFAVVVVVVVVVVDVDVDTVDVLLLVSVIGSGLEQETVLAVIAPAISNTANAATCRNFRLIQPPLAVLPKVSPPRAHPNGRFTDS